MTERGGGGGVGVAQIQRRETMGEMGMGKKMLGREVGGLSKERMEVVGYLLDMHKQETEEAGGQKQQIKLYGLVRILQRDR